MRRLFAVTAVLALLSFTACGGDDDEETPTSGATGATGATGAQGVSGGTDLTADDYIAASIPDQVEAVQDAVAADSVCEGVDAKPGGDFQVDVAIAAASAEPDTPLSEVVSDQCAEEWAAGELGDKLRGALEPALEPGETLRGACVATQSGLFKGRMVGIGVTDRRLIVQGMSRKFDPDGEPISLPPERIAEASAEGAGGGWPEVGAAIMDQAAVTLKLKSTDGEKLKLMMMRGSGPLGRLGGGEDQRSGFEALGAWFAEHGRSWPSAADG